MELCLSASNLHLQLPINFIIFIAPYLFLPFIPPSLGSSNTLFLPPVLALARYIGQLVPVLLI